jgi:DNA-directed RNA polymerase specialized sigma subunit
LTLSEERKKRVINLYDNQEKTMREIAKIEKASICDISAIFLNIILPGKILKLLTLIS